MTLELVLLISFVGMLFVSSVGNSEDGLRAQFRDSGPALAIRMEKKMATGRCFQIGKNKGGPPCETGLWQASTAK